MPDKIQKIVEVKFEGNTAKLEQAAKGLQQQFAQKRSSVSQERVAVTKKDRTDKQRFSSEKKAQKAEKDSANQVLRIARKRLQLSKQETAEVKKRAKQASDRVKDAEKENRGGGGGVISKVGGMAGKVVKAALLGLGAMVATHVSSGYQTYMQTGKAKAGLLAATKNVEGYEDAVLSGRKLGYTAQETTGQAAAIARKTGNIRDVSFAQKVSRAGVGMDFEGAAQQMGGVRQAGFAGFQEGGGGRKEMQRMIAMGMESGLEAGRLPEFAEGVSSLVAKQAAVSGGNVSNQGIAALMAKFGQTGLSGFQGTRGAAVAARLDQAIRKPGGGAEGESFMMRAQGFGTPGGNTGFMQARRQMQQGISDPRNLLRMVQQARSEFGEGEASTLALEKLTGLSIEQVEGTKAIVDQMTSGGKTEEEAMKALQVLGDKAKPIEAQVLEANKTGFLDVVHGIAAVDERLMAIGEGVWEPLHKAQLDLLDITAKNLPAVVTAVEAMAIAAGVTSDVLTGEGTTSGKVTEALGTGSDILADVTSGKIPASFAAKDIGNLIQNQEREDAQATEGFGGMLGTAMDALMVGGAKLLGSDVTTGAGQRAHAMDTTKRQEVLIRQQMQFEKERRVIAELNKQVAEANARTARSTNESLKTVGAAAAVPASVTPTPGR